VARRAWYLGGWIKHSGWYPDYQRRLYQRDVASFQGIVHESLAFQGKAGRLRGDLSHYTMNSLAEHEEKVERYTTLAARQMYEAGKRRWRAAMWLATPWTCFSTFVLRGGVLDGSRGWLISRLAMRSREAGVAVQGVARFGLRARAAAAVRKLLSKDSFDLVHLNEPHALTAGWLADAHKKLPLRLCRRVGFPFKKGWVSQ